MLQFVDLCMYICILHVPHNTPEFIPLNKLQYCFPGIFLSHMHPHQSMFWISNLASSKNLFVSFSVCFQNFFFKWLLNFFDVSSSLALDFLPQWTDIGCLILLFFRVTYFNLSSSSCYLAFTSFLCPSLHLPL